MAKTSKTKPLQLDPTILLQDIAIDDEHVIVANNEMDESRLFIVGYDGSGRRDLVPADAPEISRIAADAKGIFTGGDGGICRVDKAGEVTVLLADVCPWAIAIDDEFVYGSGSDDDNDGVVRVPRAGGDAEWIVTERSVTAIGVAGGRVYFSSDDTLCVRDGDGAIHTLAPAKNPHAIVGLSNAVVWTEFDNLGAPHSLRDGQVRALAAQNYTSDMVMIGDWLYWAQSSRKKTGPAIWRMRLEDTEPEIVAKFAGKAPRIAGNERLVCWIGDGNGGAYALPGPG